MVTGSTDAAQRQATFFISYSPADEAWASWIAWTLEEAGFRTVIQAWDFVAGSNFIDYMDRGVSESVAVIAVLSRNYQGSRYGRMEWQAALRAGPAGPQAAHRARGRGARRGAARDDHVRRSRRRPGRADRARAAPHPRRTGAGRARAPRQQPRVPGLGRRRDRPGPRAVLAAAAHRGRRAGRAAAARDRPALPPGRAGRRAPGGREHPAPRGPRVRARARAGGTAQGHPERPHRAARHRCACP
ncbi:toll/interleukin-1 receptor domain-containing protein [Streptomyces sp. AM 3-1-1]|uniref:toll/interleukin-1 receptor domain-containing protein n=1 Tax=Streptomyces sp. AM 3-1-1 TaxID=3028711 RepID=UPI0023B9B087|nr:toll/interleukin-1 receptor domain-containing protein [Streptomyces sp. AM 3-1-1]WEH28279.1 toll/interleukin-1 receptor domain-containing protein [Streptomyces sp. AM 3-1-1]